MNATLPNFLIVGAAKSGTTSLYYYLKRHPEIYMSDMKETMFFVSEIYSNISRNDPRHYIADKKIALSKDYPSLFKLATTEKAIGEASTPYLYYHKIAIPKIKKYLGEVKIIIILRNPVERAYSSYYHLTTKDGVEKASFEDFLKKEEQRKMENWDILNFPIDLGFYYGQVKAYLNKFRKVKIVLLDDLKNNPQKLLKELYSFLEVDDSFTPNTRVFYNRTIVSRNNLTDYILRTDNIYKKYSKLLLKVFLPEKKIRELGQKSKSINMRKKRMKLKTRKFLKETFRDDILKLQKLIGRDLSHWL